MLKLSEVARVLWRAKIVIILGALLSAGFAYMKTPASKTTYHAEELLIQTGVEMAAQPGTLVVGSLAQPGASRDAGNRTGLQLSMPYDVVQGTPPMHIETVRYLIKSSAALDSLARSLGEPFQRIGMSSDALAGTFNIRRVQDTKFIEILADMPTEELARREAEAVAAMTIDEAQKQLQQDTASTLTALQNRKQALEKAAERLSGAEQKPAGAPGARTDAATARLMRLMAVQLQARYEQAAISGATAASDRLAVARAAIVQPEVTASHPRRNAAIGFIMGALLIALAALGLYYWKALALQAPQPPPAVRV